MKTTVLLVSAFMLVLLFGGVFVDSQKSAPVEVGGATTTMTTTTTMMYRGLEIRLPEGMDCKIVGSLVECLLTMCFQKLPLSGSFMAAQFNSIF